MVAKFLQIKPRHLCPLSKDIMDDPVVDEFGNFYDRNFILKHIDHNGKSPIND